MSATAADLFTDFQLENALWKGGERWRTSRVRTAYLRYFRQACAEGHPPDALRRHIADERERFFARTIAGLDGHTFWEGSLDTGFVMNDGHSRRPRLWWYELVNGPVGRDVVIPACGEEHCITPEHMQRVSWADRRRRWTDAQMLGGLQVFAMRHGATPTRAQWDAERRGMPTSTIYAMRFGTWLKAIAAAGLEPAHPSNARITAEDAVAALRAFAAEHGHAPTLSEWSSGHHHPVRGTLVRLFGGYSKALIAAGLKDTAPARRDWTPEAMLAALQDAADELGHLPDHRWWQQNKRRPNRKTIARAFGSYSAALEALKAGAYRAEDAQAHEELGS